MTHTIDSSRLADRLDFITEKCDLFTLSSQHGRKTDPIRSPMPMSLEDSEHSESEPIELPIDGVLDLHTFRPPEIKELVPDYLKACQLKGILEVRIIHGKGIGNLRRTVHSILSRRSEVVSFSLAGEHFGGWGATIVHLRPVDGAATQA